MKLLKDLFVPYKVSTENITKFLILRNYIIVCSMFTFFYLTIYSISGIQSTVNKEASIGMASSAILFTVFGLTSLIIPQVLIKKIKFKWTMTLGLALQFLYVGFNAYAKWYTYLPASAFGGFGQALVYTCTSTAISQLSHLYSQVAHKNASKAEEIFFGIFGAFMEFATLMGYVLIGVILQSDVKTDRSSFNFEVCGANFCPNTELPKSAVPSLKRFYLLLGIFAISTAISVLLGISLNDIDFLRKTNENLNTKQIVKLEFKELKRQVFQWNQLLLIQVPIANSFISTFTLAEFSRSYAACTYGIQYIGWSIAVLSGSSVIASPIFGQIASKFTILTVFVIYYLIILANGIFLLLWKPDPDIIYPLFINAILLGIIDAISSSQTRALYGMIFKTDAVFSVYNLLLGVGNLFGFFISIWCCTYVKIYMIFGFVAWSTISGLILLFKIRYKKKIKRSTNNTAASETL